MPSAAVVTNLLESATKTASAEDPAHPIARIANKMPADPFGFGNTTGGDLDFDLGSAQSFDKFGLFNHNLSSGATVQLKADSFSPATTVRETAVWREGEFWLDLGPLSFQHVRVTVIDTAPENILLGEASLGAGIQLPRAHQFGKIPGKTRRQIIHDTVAGAIHAYHLWEKEIREYTWRVLASEITNFETINDAVVGRLLPFVWIPELAGAEVIYGRLLDMDFRPQELDNLQAFDIAWRLQSESYGLSVTL